MKCTDFAMPLGGRLMTIEDVPDEVFSSRSMGDGFAIEVTQDEVRAPMDGLIESVYPTGHAIMMTLDNGIQVMIHVGLESFQIIGLNKVLCKAGDHVKKGDILVRTNVRKLKQKAGTTISPIVFLGGETVTLLKKAGAEVQSGDTSIAEIEVPEK
ncbi:MAG: PTS glucose transporter subunit IIA [Erysipelotrichia bacterium]|nr:PTS glucose transporter subunit IIA [Erysipelotrichia bacterium]